MVLTEDTISLDFLIVQGKVYALLTYTGLMHWTKIKIDRKNLKKKFTWIPKVGPNDM